MHWTDMDIWRRKDGILSAMPGYLEEVVKR